MTKWISAQSQDTEVVVEFKECKLCGELCSPSHENGICYLCTTGLLYFNNDRNLLMQAVKYLDQKKYQKE